jgi:hypothetical protein
LQRRRKCDLNDLIVHSLIVRSRMR